MLNTENISQSFGFKIRSAVRWLMYRLMPRGDRLIFLAVQLMVGYVWLTFAVLFPPLELSPWRFHWAVSAVSLFFLLTIFFEDLVGILKARGSASLYLLVIMGLLALIAGWLGRQIWDLILVLVLGILAPIKLAHKTALVYVITLYVSWSTIMFFARGLAPPSAMHTIVGFSPGIVFAFVLGWVLNLHDRQKKAAEFQKATVGRLYEQARKRRDSLVAAREQERLLTIAQERAQLLDTVYRDLADALDELQVKLETTKVQLHTDPIATQTAVETCRDQAKAVLAQVRKSIAALRKDTPMVSPTRSTQRYERWRDDICS